MMPWEQGSCPQTQQLSSDAQIQFPFPILHEWSEDEESSDVFGRESSQIHGTKCLPIKLINWTCIDIENQ